MKISIFLRRGEEEVGVDVNRCREKGITREALREWGRRGDILMTEARPGCGLCKY